MRVIRYVNGIKKSKTDIKNGKLSSDIISEVINRQIKK